MEFKIDLKTTGAEAVRSAAESVREFGEAATESGKKMAELGKATKLGDRSAAALEPASAKSLRSGASDAVKQSQAGLKAIEAEQKAFRDLSTNIGSRVKADMGGSKAGAALRGEFGKAAKQQDDDLKKKGAQEIADRQKRLGTGKGGDTMAKLGLGKLSALGKGGALAAVAAAVIGISTAAIAASRSIVRFGVDAALAFRGLGAYSAQMTRLEMNQKRLFQGVDTTPLVRAAQRAADYFDRTRETGSTMAKILQNGVNLYMRAVEAAVPVVEGFVTGAMIGYLRVSTAAKKLATAATNAFTSLVESGNPVVMAILKIGKSFDLAKTATDAGIGAFYVVAGALGIFAAAIAIPAAGLALLSGGIAYVVTKIAGLLQATGLAEPLLKVLKVVGAGVAASFLVVGAAALGIVFGIGWLIGKVGEAVAWFNKTTGASAAATAAFNAVWSVLTGLGGKALALGANLALGIAKGIASAVGSVIDAAKGLVEGAVGAVTTAAKIKSPSRLFATYGNYMGQGVAVGFEQAAPTVERAAATSLMPSVPFNPGATTDAVRRGVVAEAKSAGGGGAAGTTGGAGAGVVVNFNAPVYLGEDPADAATVRGVERVMKRAVRAAQGA